MALTLSLFNSDVAGMGSQQRVRLLALLYLFILDDKRQEKRCETMQKEGVPVASNA